MTLTFFNTGDKPASTVWNENYRHVGRCGFSTFYGMDSSGNYAAQPLGSVAQPWLSANIGTISIASDTITAVGTNAPLKLEATGTARVEIGRVFGEWEFDTTNTLYPIYEIFKAPSDIFVIIRFYGSDYGQINVDTGSTTPPTNCIVEAGFDNQQPDLGTVSFPIRKGDYWTFYPTTHDFNSYTVCVIPIGG